MKTPWYRVPISTAYWRFSMIVIATSMFTGGPLKVHWILLLGAIAVTFLILGAQLIAASRHRRGTR